MVDFYDEFTYESNPFPETHPMNLAVLGHLLGVPVTPPERCRVLELGGGTGGNLIPMAWHWPQAEFTGFELSAPQVAIGQDLITSLGLKNIRFRQGDIMDLQPERIGTFDYIVVHGVYSWVPAPVREKILQLARACLTPGGIAYISYNTLPGWRMRGGLRDLLLYATQGAETVTAKLERAQAALERLHAALGETSLLGGKYLRAEIEYLRKAHPSYLLHEYLAAENNAFLFTEFIADAARHGLQYLCETDLHTAFTETLGQAAADALADLDNDPIASEQWMDFVRVRTFRQTLLVRDDVPLSRELAIEAFTALFFSANMQVQGKLDLRRKQPQTFHTGGGESMQVEHPLTKAALPRLKEVFPHSLSFAELYALASEAVRQAGKPGFAGERDDFVQELFSLFAHAAVRAHLQPHPRALGTGRYPKASALAREQAARGWSKLATVHHQGLDMDAFSTSLLLLLDGARTREELAEIQYARLQSGEIGRAAIGAGGILNRAHIQQNVDHLLGIFTRHGLLV